VGVLFEVDILVNQQSVYLLDRVAYLVGYFEVVSAELVGQILEMVF